jgi:hypothetical protein
MLRRTLRRVKGDCVFRCFEHPTRGTIQTITYPCGRVVFVASGFRTMKLKKRKGGPGKPNRRRIGEMLSIGKKSAGGGA